MDLKRPVRQAYLSYRALFHWLNWPAYVSNVFLRPGLQVAIFALAGRFARGSDASDAFVIGMIAYSLLWIIMGGILQSFYNERSFGTLSLVFASTSSRLQTYLIRGVLHWPNAAITVAIALFTGRVFLGMDMGAADWLAVAAGFVALSVSAIAFGLMMGNACIVLRDWIAVLAWVSFVTMSLTGAIIPRSSLPGPLGELSSVLPVSHALSAIRQGFAGGSLSQVKAELGWELLLAAVFVLIGYAAFRAVELHARRSGQYETI